MKILAFAATTSSTSINKQLVAHAIELIEDGLVPDATVETLDLNDYELPIYSVDRQEELGIPQLAQDFYDKIGSADAVIVSFAEHNGSYTTAYKNIFDWATRIDMRLYQDKPTVMLATSAGPTGGSIVLNGALALDQYFGYDIRSSMSIPDFYKTFDMEAGVLRDPETEAEFRSTIAALASVPADVGSPPAAGPGSGGGDGNGNAVEHSVS
jgi:chromate reductase, NAD(P)H dehydrogenase (quinone)